MAPIVASRMATQPDGRCRTVTSAYRRSDRSGVEVVLETLDAPAVRRWSLAAAAALAAHQDEIDDLNVYPVPDGDTGTNLALTLRAAADALAADASATGAGALRVMARGAVMGARGNSGVIVSQILLGFADAVEVDCDAPAMQLALRKAAEH